MSRLARRGTATPRLFLEFLEARTLLSTASSPLFDPATSLLVRFAPGLSSAQIKADLSFVGGKIVESFSAGPSIVALGAGLSPSIAAGLLKSDAGVVYAEVDTTLHATAVTVTPTDPLASQQWSLTQVDAPYAWGVTTGTSATIVAVVDTGVDLANPEFAGRIWTNTNTSGSDGYRGDLHGWNFVNNTSNVQDNNGHGSHVTGILAAAGNNGYGIAGIDWNAVIMPLKILDSQGNGTTTAAVSAVYFAVDHGAKVINASWGGDIFSQAMLDALNYANAHGVVFVTAAGNDTSNNDVTATYPASYRTPNELVVAAVDQYGNLADFSNFGATTVDVAAPGVNIISTVPHSISSTGFAVYSGTSMATPVVAGAVALLAGLNSNLSAAQLVAQIRATVKPVASLVGQMISPGIVDPYFALINHVTTGFLSQSSHPAPTKTAPNLVAGSSTPEDVEAGLLISDTFFNQQGAGYTAGYVTAVYQALFARAAGAEELSYYASALLAGEARYTFVSVLQASPEGLLTRVARWYSDEFGSPTPLATLKSDPGVISFAALLAAGTSDVDAQAAIFSSDSYYASAGGNPTGFLSALYYQILGRTPDQGGIDYYTAELNAGASRLSVVDQFLHSPEAHLTLVANLYRDELNSTAPLSSLKTDSGVAYWAAFLA